jgi:hypothetical protein
LLVKFEINYGREGFEDRNNFLYRNFFRLEMDLELKIWEARSIFYIRKLIKIARIELKIQNNLWR